MSNFLQTIDIKIPKPSSVIISLAQILKRFRNFIIFLRHRGKLDNIVLNQSQNHKHYIYSQLKRTLPKKDSLIQHRTIVLIDQTAKYIDLSTTSTILCIGCRNLTEIDYFRKKGSKNVIGIDIFSEQKDIIVMDMHNMTFPDNSFEVVYCSHSLEHSLNVSQVIREIVRVIRPCGILVIEVPINYQTRGADLVDFKDLDTLKHSFETHLDQVLWSDKQPAYSPTNESGTEILRTIFQMSEFK